MLSSPLFLLQKLNWETEYGWLLDVCLSLELCAIERFRPLPKLSFSHTPTAALLSLPACIPLWLTVARVEERWKTEFHCVLAHGHCWRLANQPRCVAGPSLSSIRQKHLELSIHGGASQPLARIVFPCWLPRDKVWLWETSCHCAPRQLECEDQQLCLLPRRAEWAVAIRELVAYSTNRSGGRGCRIGLTSSAARRTSYGHHWRDRVLI